MFGAFKSSLVMLGGRLNKIPWRLSSTRKANVRKRLKAVDNVISSIAASGVKFNALDEALTLLEEHRMAPRNKYWVFSRNHGTGLRKGVHKVPKFTKADLPRVWPKGLGEKLSSRLSTKLSSKFTSRLPARPTVNK